MFESERELSEQDLKKVTMEAFKLLRTYDMVPPELYRETFCDVAAKQNVDLDSIDTAEVSKTILATSVADLEKQQEASMESLEALKTTTSEANAAIERKDTKALEKTQDDIAALTEKISQLEKMNFSDELTGVKNRRWLYNQFLDNEKFVSDGIVGFIDLNNFKIVNDTYGHNIGDKVLVLVSHLLGQLNKMGRPVEVVRFGGDEFLVLAPETNLRVLETELRTIKGHLESKIVNIKDVSFKTGFSFGCYEYKKSEDFPLALEAVDQKMYDAKAADKSKEKA